jgi:hypothetical protein
MTWRGCSGTATPSEAAPTVVVCREGARAHSFYCASELLGIDERDVAAAMTFRSVVAGGETYKVRARARAHALRGLSGLTQMAQVPLSAEQASHSRDALARSLYVLDPSKRTHVRARTHTYAHRSLTALSLCIPPTTRAGTVCCASRLRSHCACVGAGLHATCSLSSVKGGQGWSSAALASLGFRGAVQRATCIVRAAASNVRAALQRVTCKNPPYNARHATRNL